MLSSKTLIIIGVALLVYWMFFYNK